MTSFVWIQTRDGSPTLWHNGLGESFRSVRGAFTESWAAFVGPALAQARNDATVGEFGLGAGTNWLIWTLASRAKGLKSSYFAIERDTSSFKMGFEKWFAQGDLLAEFFSQRGISLSVDEIMDTLKSAPLPRAFASLAEAAQAGARCDVWFHDPFGYDVNPEGYSVETLRECAKLWNASVWGGSYACNKYFREALESLGGIEARIVPTGAPDLKRERTEFCGRGQV